MSSNINTNTAPAAASGRRNPRQQQWRPQQHRNPNPNPNPNPPNPNNPTPKPALRKPVFVKVDQLKPGTAGHTLTAMVLTSDSVPSKGRGGAGAGSQQMGFGKERAGSIRIAECLIGDETGTIIFTARNEQVDLLKPGATVIIRNAKIDMFKGTMRLAVDKWGRIEVTEPADFVVKEDNNLSLVEYELVNVVEE